MPESEFDKQVQQEMEGLRLRPSAAVWENVEKELRRKKRRRYIVFFWLLAGLGLLGYSGYFLTQKGKPTLAESSGTPADHSSKRKAVQQPAQSATAPSTINPTDNTNPVDQNIQLKENTTVTATQPATAAPANGEGLNSNKTIAPAPSNKNKGTVRKRKAGNVDQSSAGKDQLTGAGKGKNDQTELPVAESGIKKEIINTPETKETESKTNDITAQTLPVTPQDSVKAKADSAVAAAPPAETKAPVVKKQSSSKIKWSLDLGVGGSGPISSPFLIGDPDKSNRASYDQNGMYTPSPGSPLVTPPVNYGGPIYYPRSDIKPGPAFRIGILGEWAISKRSSIVSGLQYQYQSNNIRTGSYVNTALVFNNNASQQVSVRSLYQGSQQKTFTNRFHYLQIPVTFQWQVNKGKKMPILLNAGLSAGYLLTTNALVYDSLQGGIYYHDKQAFNRFMFSFNTGLAFRFGNNKPIQWSIGPEVSMGLRSQVKEGYDKKQYPFYLGIQARLYWPKKK